MNFIFFFLMGFYLKKNFFKFIYFERDSTRGRRAERKGGRENPKQAPCCQCRARCGARTHEATRSWTKPKPRIRRLTNWASQTPQNVNLKIEHRGAWVAQSVGRPTSAQVTISRSRGPWVRAPRRAPGWWLRAWSLLLILSPSLSAPPRSCSVSLSLSQK